MGKDGGEALVEERDGDLGHGFAPAPDKILRIEDTDSQRFVPGAEDYIIEALTWLGIKFDEACYSPVRRSPAIYC